MSFLRTLLQHTCDVRHVAETENPLGGPTRAYGEVVRGVPCRIEEKAERAYSDARARFIVNTRLLLYFAPDADVRESDVIDNLTVDGVQDTRTFRVRSVRRRALGSGKLHHIVAEVEAL